MKAITLKQPDAWGITHAGRLVLGREWETSHRGLLAIHAGRQRRKAKYPERLPDGTPIPQGQLAFTAIVGVAELVAVLEPDTWHAASEKVRQRMPPAVRLAMEQPTEAPFVWIFSRS